jgi:hypothetical protein
VFCEFWQLEFLVRHLTGTATEQEQMTEAEQNARHALQEAMDRRDNGGETGH